MNEPLISIIIPVYNMEDYLSRCLDSVLNNTYRNLEVICVDDGSRDSSLKILREYEAKDSRIVVIAKENGGVSSARNAGLDRMTGEYVSFVDPDDFVHPQYIELLFDGHQQTECDMIACKLQKVGEHESMPEMLEIAFSEIDVSVVTCKEHFQDDALRSYSCGRLIRTNDVANLRFHKELRFAEDAVFLGELWEENENLTCCVIKERLYFYYQHEGSLVKLSTKDDRLNLYKLLLKKSKQSEQCEQIYFEQSIKRLLSFRYLSAHISADWVANRESSAVLRSCLGQLICTNYISTKNKAFYIVSIFFPGLYWLYRIKAEPNMWRWEKMERKKRREKMKTKRDDEEAVPSKR